MIENFVVQKAVLRHSDGSYLILRRSATDVVRPGDWDLPGGMQDPGETLEEGALREIIEEVGITPTALLPRYTFNKYTEIDGKDKNYMQIIYAATTDTKEVVLSHEHDFHEWLNGAEFIERFASQLRYQKPVSYIIDNKLDLLA